MKLSQMFTGQTQVGEVMHREETHAQQTAKNTASINRQIRSLVPGQTISGEIVGRNGGEVQIKLADDMVLNARVDRNLNIEIGKNMTFEVKNNGSALTLSPLFTNVSTDVNVLKALDMAALPVNRTSVEMTEKLMEAGLPVNRNTLLQVYREITGDTDSKLSAGGGGNYARVVANGISFGPSISGSPKPQGLPVAHGGAHSPDEALHIESWITGMKIYAKSVLLLDEALPVD